MESRTNVKVYRGSTFMFTRHLSYIAFILFKDDFDCCVIFTCVLTYILRALIN